jgi:hypothetical protein
MFKTDRNQKTSTPLFRSLTKNRGEGESPTSYPSSTLSSALATRLPWAQSKGHSPSSISFISPAYEHQPRKSLVSPTYAKTGGCTPTQECRRADIFDFPPYFSHLACPERSRRACPESDRRVTARHLPASEGGRYTRTERRQECLRHQSLVTQSPVTFFPPVGFITTVLRGYCTGPWQAGSYQNPGYFPGARPAGMSPFCLQVPRCRRLIARSWTALNGAIFSSPFFPPSLC